MRNRILLFLVIVFVNITAKNGDLNLWIDEQQVKMFSGECDNHVFPVATNGINIHVT
jgi:hypothetical protein